MKFLKRHYEKILLGGMLAGLIGVLVFMLIYIASDKEGMENKRISLIGRAKPLADLDLTPEQNSMTRITAPYQLDFDTRNKLLNPMEWQKDANGSLVQVGTQTGPQKAVVTNITSLYLVIKLASANTNLGVSYYITVEHQGAATPAKRLPFPHYVGVGDKPNDTFGLTQVQGPPDNPTALLLKLVDTGEVVPINKDKPYRRVEAYAADIRYDPERKTYHNVRVGGHIPIGGIDYLVDEITSDEVTLKDPSNQKKTALPFNP